MNAQSGLLCEIRIRHGDILIPVVISACGARSDKSEEICPLPVIGYTVGNDDDSHHMWESLRSNSSCAIIEAVTPLRGSAPGQSVAVYQVRIDDYNTTNGL